MWRPCTPFSDEKPNELRNRGTYPKSCEKNPNPEQEEAGVFSRSLFGLAIRLTFGMDPEDLGLGFCSSKGPDQHGTFHGAGDLSFLK